MLNFGFDFVLKETDKFIFAVLKIRSRKIGVAVYGLICLVLACNAILGVIIKIYDLTGPPHPQKQQVPQYETITLPDGTKMTRPVYPDNPNIHCAATSTYSAISADGPSTSVKVIGGDSVCIPKFVESNNGAKVDVYGHHEYNPK